MNRFDRIEKRIRGIFEASTAFLPWSNQSAHLVNRLCEAIRLYYSDKDANDTSSVPLFQIVLNPLTLNNWKKQPEWEQTFAEALKSSSLEFGVVLNSPPAFTITARNSLSEDEVLINLVDTKTPINKTSAIPLQPGFVEGKNIPPIENSCLLIQGDKTIPLIKPVINIGRKSSNNIVINDLRISRTHAQIRRVQDEYIIFDIGSTGGTFVNGERIDHYTLRPGDVISLAGYTMIFTKDQVNTIGMTRGKTSEIKTRPDMEGV